jgi:paraquat-inducible protein B
MLSGGVAFDTSETARQSQPAKADTVFALFDNRAAAIEAGYTKRLRFLVEFEGSVRGLEIGAPVETKGMKIGQVVDFHLIVDAAKDTVRVPVLCEIDLGRTNIANQSPDQAGKGILIADLVKRGLRAQLRSGNLLTGQLVVALEFFPDAPPAEIVETETYPELPTVPSQMESLTRTVSETMDKIAALPVDDIVKTARSTLTSADAVLKSMGSGYGANSQIHRELAALLVQLQDAARSMRTLASYLEQHPDAVIRGKPNSP